MKVACPARPITCLAAVATAGVLTACSGPGQPPSAERGSAAPLQPSPSHVAQFLPPSSPAAVPIATAPRPFAAGPGPCGTSELRLATGPASGAAGSIYYPLRLTNISAAACTLYGYPGAAFVTAPGGSMIGGPAVRNPADARELVTLVPGATAHSSLQVVVAANFPSRVCRPVIAHWLQVIPPDQVTALYVGFTAQTCTGTIPSGSTLGIFAVRPGATGP